MTETLEIIPEDDEYFSTEVKYKFDFDKDPIPKSNILETCEDGGYLEEHITSSMIVDKESSNDHHSVD